MLQVTLQYTRSFDWKFGIGMFGLNKKSIYYKTNFEGKEQGGIRTPDVVRSSWRSVLADVD